MPKNNCFGASFKLDLHSAMALPKPPTTLCSSTETISFECLQDSFIANLSIGLILWKTFLMR